MSIQLRPAFPSATEESLRCEVVPDRERVRVRPIGSLDLATVPVLEECLDELRAAGFCDIVIDLQGLAFMDSTGLRLILRSHAAARSDGLELALVPGSPQIQRVFELTGTTGIVPFVRSA